MKTLITKADGTPTKSKMHAVQFLSKLGISKDCLIEENGQFYFEEECPKEGNFVVDAPRGEENVTWETPVFDKNNNKTQLFIPNTDITATINAKLPAGQLRDYSAFEINIGNENFAMSLDLVSKIFKVRG
ncbi:MAG: hypothetical protein IIZ99_00215 [Turicibacter sp.]|nr:hypothetical protein [Turicibacter sp.]